MRVEGIWRRSRVVRTDAARGPKSHATHPPPAQPPNPLRTNLSERISPNKSFRTNLSENDCLEADALQQLDGAAAERRVGIGVGVVGDGRGAVAVPARRDVAAAGDERAGQLELEPVLALAPVEMACHIRISALNHYTVT